MIKKILKLLRSQLSRELNVEEVESFSKPRSLSAYELMIDFIEQSDKQEIEKYVRSLVNESNH